MRTFHKDLEHQILRIVVNESSKSELKKISLNLHRELIRYCEIIGQLLRVKRLNNNGLLHPISDLLLCRKSYKQKWELVQRICWQYVEISAAIDWVCEHNSYTLIFADSVEKLPDVLSSFYQQKVPAVLGVNCFKFFINQYRQMSMVEIVDSLILEHEKLSEKIYAFHCLHRRIMEKSNVRTGKN